MVSFGITREAAKLAVLTVNALYGLLSFYQRDVKELNVDGAFGLRLIQGELDSLLHLIHGNVHHFPPQLIAELRNLSRLADQIANDAKPYVFQDDEKYFDEFRFILTQPYRVLSPEHYLTEPRLLWPSIGGGFEGDPIEESASDKCMREMFGSVELRKNRSSVEKNRQPSVPNNEAKDGGTNDLCPLVSKQCLTLMLENRGRHGYELTHQILYVSIAQLTNCTDALDRFVRKIRRFRREGILGWLKEWCTNCLEDLTAEYKRAKNGRTLSARKQDLMMEQILTCGQFGFSEFVRRDWMERILSWQQPNGCFSELTKDEIDEEEEDNGPTVDEMQNDKILREMQRAHEEFKDKQRQERGRPKVRGARVKRSNGDNLDEQQLPRFRQRRLMVEKMTKDNCGGHMNAVAAGALTVFLRFLLDPGPVEYGHLSLARQKKSGKPISVDGMFRQLDTTHWLVLDDADYHDDFIVEGIQPKPPSSPLRDLTGYFVFSMFLLFLYVSWRLFFRRKPRRPLYPFAYKKL